MFQIFIHTIAYMFTDSKSVTLTLEVPEFKKF